MIGARLVWAISNFIVFACMLATTILSWISYDLYSSKLQHIVGADKTVKTSALILFSLLGLPLSVSTRPSTPSFSATGRCLIPSALAYTDHLQRSVLGDRRADCRNRRRTRFVSPVFASLHCVSVVLSRLRMSAHVQVWLLEF